MSVNYASGLSPYEHKGKCGMKEIFDEPEILEKACDQLAEMIRNSRNLVVITGAGVSTSAGIPDFRGPKGVWTLEERGETPKLDVTFETARPTLTHMALVALEKKNILKHLVSQNVDGLHMRSGFPMNKLSELHGNMFLEQCDLCKNKYIRSSVVPTMAKKITGSKCRVQKHKGFCRGNMRDTILDWEDELPVNELNISEEFCRNSDLCLCLGTSLQIMPCGNMPLLTKKNGGRVALVNLQKTRIDNKCDLKIWAFVDDVMRRVCERLDVKILTWTEPVINTKSTHSIQQPLDHNFSSKSDDDTADNNDHTKGNKRNYKKKHNSLDSKFLIDECYSNARNGNDDSNLSDSKIADTKDFAVVNNMKRKFDS
ncbi:hypothetical protein HELRODRAFT_185545 [Helobdella robusta]|uniref:protein acetyllysine N-acetyltransferase n=1 Tax=Helobdella robusta TaxID=6412 RepID=T1FMY8_HELRO|nr:hypothetical protein HELRODRAFT_185545 [Helobdella robusta]ESO05059.1 hypothetical protein HELRODRAFT_185545 [Helobdella robusta]